MRRIHRLTAATILTASCALLAGCGDDDEPATSTTKASATTGAGTTAAPGGTTAANANASPDGGKAAQLAKAFIAAGQSAGAKFDEACVNEKMAKIPPADLDKILAAFATDPALKTEPAGVSDAAKAAMASAVSCVTSFPTKST